MLRNKRFGLILLTAAFVGGFVFGNLLQTQEIVSAQSDRVFELRTYTTNDGKLPNLLARFRDHTTRIFEGHGMTNVGYWVPEDAKDHPASTLIYVISHGSRDAATAGKLYHQLSPLKECVFDTDDGKGYSKVWPTERHVIGKKTQFTWNRKQLQ